MEIRKVFEGHIGAKIFSPAVVSFYYNAQVSGKDIHETWQIFPGKEASEDEIVAAVLKEAVATYLGTPFKLEVSKDVIRNKNVEYGIKIFSATVNLGIPDSDA
jgi:hypothetical protein